MRMCVVILVMIASILVLAFSMAAQGNSSLDPFSLYSDLLLSDQLWTERTGRKYSCIEVFSGVLVTSCSFKPKDGVFSKIYVTIKDNKVESISFHAITDVLRVGDLIALWGRPNRLYPHIESTIMWTELDDFTVTAVVPSADRLNYLAPVWVVTFTF